MKIIDKINSSEGLFYSFEFFPPKTEAGVQNLYARMCRMATLEPLFVDVTWGTGGSTAELTLDISSKAQKYCGLEVLMHLTCTNMSLDSIRMALDAAKQAGIQNILALRGDPSRGNAVKEKATFKYAIDLVRFIREEYGDYFGIGVAGFPEGHPENADDKEQGIRFLREKVEAGADFIITQLFYDAEALIAFVDDCRVGGITCPIIPGILPIQNFSGFKKMTDFCKLKVPEQIWTDLKPIKDNDEAVKEYGVELAQKMCRRILCPDNKNPIRGVHFYTLNLERSVRNILDGLGVRSDCANRRPLPWRPSTLSERAQEDVRPIFWANRPTSYLKRTASWDEFPNGRWGDNRSPAYGDVLGVSHFAPFRLGSIRECKSMWGECPVTYDDIYQVFVQYINGKIQRLPWCEVALNLETILIKQQLMKVNAAGFLTINSQPRVNAAPSDDPSFGWGGPGGVVYQKAYVECFVSPANLKLLMDACSRSSSLMFQAADHAGHTYSNWTGGSTGGVSAVTWGVFPNKEVLQPTVVDPNSFMAWKDEAFDLWTNVWGSLYDEESPAKALLQDVHDNFFLVWIVDNNFISGDIWAVFEEVIAAEQSR